MKITDVVARDIRFPTSKTLAGSDAMHTDPDYSAAYVVLKSDSPHGLEGHGLTFTLGRPSRRDGVHYVGLARAAPLLAVGPVHLHHLHSGSAQVAGQRRSI